MARVPSPPHGLTDDTPFPPDCSSRYAPVRRLAQGGFGRVFLARHRDLERPVVIKLLLSNLLEDTGQVDRFHQEAKITAALRHPNLVQVFDFGAQYGIPWIAYEYVEGRSLREVLDAGELSFDRALDAVSQVAEALEAAHERGILHRDVKPDNVLVDASGRFRVTDFGIAKWSREGAVETRTGLVLGTPAYVSPEQIRGEEATPASDLYALGVMLHEMVTGRPPYVAAGPLGVLELHLRGPLPRPTDSRPELPAGINRVVARAMAKAAADRHGSLRELREDLERLRGTPAAEVAHTRIVRRPESGGATWKRGVGAVVVAMVLALATGIVWRGEEPRALEAGPPRLRPYLSLGPEEKEELERYNQQVIQPLESARSRLSNAYFADPDQLLIDPARRARMMEELGQQLPRFTAQIREARGRWEFHAYLMRHLSSSSLLMCEILEDMTSRQVSLQPLAPAGQALRDELEKPAEGPLLRALQRELGSRVDQLLESRVDSSMRLTAIQVDSLEELLDHFEGWRAPDCYELQSLIEHCRRVVNSQTVFLQREAQSERDLTAARQAGERLYRSIVLRVAPYYLTISAQDRRDVAMAPVMLNLVTRFAVLRDIGHEARRVAFRRAIEVATIGETLIAGDGNCPECLSDALINLRKGAKKFGPLPAAESALLERLEKATPPR